MLIDVTAVTAAPPERVWQVLTDWERQPDWMVDAREVEVLTAARHGVGVVVRCPTDLLGLVVEDRMRVTDWRPPRRLEVVHVGRLIQGTATFELAPEDGGTRIRWWESIDPPLGPLGELGARLIVAPWVRRLFRRSLANLVAVAEEVEVPRDAGEADPLVS